MVLVGPSGCGKTTFINVIAGLVEAWEGTVTFDGKNDRRTRSSSGHGVSGLRDHAVANG